MKRSIEISDKFFESLTSIDKTEIASSFSEYGLDALRDEFQDKEKVGELLHMQAGFDTDAAWEKVVARCADLHPSPAGYRKNALRKWIGISAAAMVFLIATGLFIFIDSGSGEATENALNLNSDMVASRTLSLPEQSSDEGYVPEVPAPAPVAQAKEEVVPAVDDENERAETSPVKHLQDSPKVTTVHETEEFVTLPDGSSVHLSHGSRLIYPEDFDTESRDVYLEGSAYFTVVRNEGVPFTVHIPDASAKVYGTEFFVSAKEEGKSRVVLLRGSVGVKPIEKEEVIMKPGQVATIRGGKAQVDEIDLLPYSAWHEGSLDFSGLSLRRLMNVVAVWHDKKVLFSDASLWEVTVSGRLERAANVWGTLSSISAVTGCDITCRGDTMVLTPRKKLKQNKK